MTLIVRNANLTNLAKTTEAVATWMKKHGGRKRITVEWLTPNGCMVYSNGEADKEVINVRGDNNDQGRIKQAKKFAKGI